MSKDAIDRCVLEFATWTKLKCIKHLAKIRWGSFTRTVCPHCNTAGDHYWSPKQLRWKCTGCGSRFSVTSKTLFADRKMPLQSLLASLHLWAAGAAGQPALEIRRMMKFGGYNTAFNFISKLREGLVRGFNVGLINGVVEMDGAHASGRRASEKRGRPLKYQYAEDAQERREDALLTVSARQKAKRQQKKEAALAAGGVLHPEHGKVFPANRRIVFTLRRRSNVKGRGATVTRVGVAMTESPEAVEALVAKYVVTPESILATDTGTAT